MIPDHYIFDFDSTFTNTEALELLADISAENEVDRKQVIDEISELTHQAMNGDLSFREALEQRLELIKPNRAHIKKLAGELSKRVSKSIVRNRIFFEEHGENVYILSNGFKEFIVPVVEEYGIDKSRVFANTFLFNASDEVIGFDKENPLSSDNGKFKVLSDLKLSGEIAVIGDGHNDYQIKAAGLPCQFYAFTENVFRQNVAEAADHVAPSFDEFLYVHKMNKVLSYPKNRIKVLLLENIHSQAFDRLTQEGYKVEKLDHALSEDELIKAIKDVSVIGIRSKTQITAKVLANAPRLISIGAFCIGTNQIDLIEAQKQGVAVFNAPYSNTRSVVELAIGQMIMLMRHIPERNARMHEGNWQKSAANSFEIRGKILGIVGYGNIGAQLSVLAEGMGMRVYYYDTAEKLALGNATKCQSLEELLGLADVVSLHVDGRPQNENLMNAERLGQMKPGAVLLNLSRGHVIEIDALRACIDSGQIRGAAVDVFPEEPKSNKDPFQSSLVGARNTILTPHIGGSTQEAQENIADFVPSKIMEYVNTGSTDTSVNFPNLQLPTFEQAHRLMHIHHNVPGILAKINQILAQFDINILGQYLKTNEHIGYVITDIDKEYSKEVIKALKSIEHTIRFRALY